jgi:DNA replication protein DnaC
VAVVFWKYVRILEGERELGGSECSRVFESLRWLADFNSAEGSSSKEEEDRIQAEKHFDFVRKFRFVDVRASKAASEVHWLDVVFTTLRKLDTDDFIRMNLPQEFWEKSEVPVSVREPLRVYGRKLDSMLQDGVGVYLYGPTGVGKSLSAATLAKVVRSHGRSVFFVSVSDLMEMIRNRIPFDEDHSVMDRCKHVDFLVLDDFKSEGLEHSKQASSVVVVEEVIRHRSQWKRSTFLTSRIPPTERPYASLALKANFSGIWEIARSSCLWLEVVGEDLRRDIQKTIKDRFVDKAKK